ncbi:MAG: 3-hydroxyacyl-ACP dehydratase FabZ [Burkholderiaceae bacterium]|jgi:3-hydroxyacyl-[acyl-carrier-protein] dehydratase|nr:3-hydroxyacyl-ACP dehydratase FabZ [Burkholderiaceae bacterium]
MMDIYRILEKLPHRYPFLLVDRVLDIDMRSKTIRAVKNVTVNEPCFMGHFPGRPIFPGVLMLEALAQTCALLSFETEALSLGDDSVFYFVGIDGARFKRPVQPGDQLMLHSAMDRSRAGIYKFNCRAEVEGDTAAEAQIMCTMRKVA